MTLEDKSATLSVMYGQGRVYRRGKTWWLDFWAHGRRYQESAKTQNEREAHDLLAIRRAEIVQGLFRGLRPERTTIAHLLELVVEDYQEAERKSLPQLHSRIERHLKPKLGKIKSAQFTQRDLKRYRQARRAKGASPATVNRELEVLRRAFRLGAEHEPPLVLATPVIRLDSEDNIRRGFVAHDQYQALRDQLPPHLRLMAIIGYHVGLRAGIIRHLRWDWVDLAGRKIRLPMGTHNKRNPAVVPIYGEMVGALEMALAERDQLFPRCPWVVHIHGRQPNPDITHQGGWKSACRRAGVEGLLFHDLRRSAIRNMRLAGIPETEAMVISGHRTRATFERYNIVAERDIERAGERMQAWQERQQQAWRSDGYGRSS